MSHEETRIKLDVTRRCPFTGEVKTRTFELPVVEVTLIYQGQLPIQEAAPSLNAEEREFVLTGIDGETWSKYVGNGDDE